MDYETATIIIIFLFGMFTGIMISDMMGNTLITTSSLDSACVQLYGENYTYYDNSWLTDTYFSCKEKDKINIIKKGE